MEKKHARVKQCLNKGGEHLKDGYSGGNIHIIAEKIIRKL
jgi:hypothetical protein